MRKARTLCLEAAAETPRVLKEPAPVCLLLGFGDSSVEPELRIWIQDPRNGVNNVKSEVLLLVWDKSSMRRESRFPIRSATCT